MMKPPYTYALKGHKHLRVYQPTLPLYNIPYYIYIGRTVSDAAKYAETDHPGVGFEELVTANTGAYAINLIHPEHGSSYCMLFGTELFESDEFCPLGTIAHEALHLSWFIGNDLGLIYEYDNHEAQAYMMQDIIETTVEALKDYAKRYKLNINF